jgi:hypothetical protein
MFDDGPSDLINIVSNLEQELSSELEEHFPEVVCEDIYDFFASCGIHNSWEERFLSGEILPSHEQFVVPKTFITNLRETPSYFADFSSWPVENNFFMNSYECMGAEERSNFNLNDYVYTDREGLISYLAAFKFEDPEQNMPCLLAELIGCDQDFLSARSLVEEWKDMFTMSTYNCLDRIAFRHEADLVMEPLETIFNIGESHYSEVKMKYDQISRIAEDLSMPLFEERAKETVFSGILDAANNLRLEVEHEKVSSLIEFSKRINRSSLLGMEQVYARIKGDQVWQDIRNAVRGGDNLGDILEVIEKTRKDLRGI